MTTIEVFTDGSCIKNGNILGGYGIYFPNNELKSISRKFTHEPITNQRAELYAIYVALILIKKNLDFDKIIIYTDSEYSIKCFTQWIKKWKRNGWKSSSGSKVKNQDIIQPVSNILDKLSGQVEFKHVRSHTGKKDRLSIANSIADKLATTGAMKSKNITKE